MVVGYLVLTLGWEGDTGICASIAEIAHRRHTLVSPSNILRAADPNSRRRLFADDGIPIEPAIDGRLGRSSGVWEE